MKKILWALLICAAGISYVSAETLQQGIVTIEGKVLTAEGKPLKKASVAINGTMGKTNNKGHFQIESQSQSHYEVHVDKPGWYASRHTFSHRELNSTPSVLEDTGHLQIPEIRIVEKRPGRVLLAFGGDTMMGRRYLEPRAGEPALIHPDSFEQDMKSVLAHMRPYLSLADYASVNLETQLWAGDAPPSLPKSVTFYTSPEIVKALNWAGVDYVALGNNHTFDYLDKGLKATLDALNNQNMASSGAGFNEQSARQPYKNSLSNQPYEWLSYVGWPGTFKPSQVAEGQKGGAALGSLQAVSEDLSNASNNATTIVQMHAGLEYRDQPSLSEVTHYRSMIDQGADLVLGHHSHVLQGLDLHKNKLIAYSLGNFAFDQYIYSTQLSMLLYVWMDGDQFYRAEIVPIHINGYVPTPATDLIRYDILQRMTRLSNQDALAFQTSGGHAQIAQRQQSITLEQLDASEVAKGQVVHIRELGVDPLKPYKGVKNNNAPYRLGVDLIKRGSFEHSGEFDTEDRTWLINGKNTRISSSNNGNPDGSWLEITGQAETGLKVFERAFTPSTPMTFTATFEATGDSQIHVQLQRRTTRQSFQDALEEGPKRTLGRISLKAGETRTVSFDGVMPRRPTRGVRVLISVEQPQDARLKVDDITWVEWRTPWHDAGQSIPGPLQTQSTHLQLSR